jgi:hypothetical protein
MPHNRYPPLQADSSDVFLLTGDGNEVEYDAFVRLFNSLSQDGVVVSTKYPASTLSEDISGGDLTIVDCTRADGVSVASDGQAVTTASCGNLTRLGMRISDAIERHAETEKAVLGFHSLSQLLAFHSPDIVGQFLQVVVGQLRNHKLGGIFMAPRQANDAPEFAIVRTQFDYVVGLHRAETGLMKAKVEGKADTGGEWRSIES